MSRKIIKMPQSLSAKLIGLFLIMALLFTVIVSVNIALSFKNNFQNNVRPHLIQYLEYVYSDIGNPPDIEKARRIADISPIEISIVSADVNWSSHKEKIVLESINYYREFKKNNISYQLGEFNGREYFVIEQTAFTLLFSIPHPHKNFQIKHVIPLVLVLILLFVFYLLIRKVFQPVKTIEQGIKIIGQGDLSHRIVVNRQDELGLLASSINSMAEDIQKMLDAKRQLLLAISHEIRTPVTRARVAAEMLDNEYYKNEIVSDLDEIETLTEEILETERLSNNHRVLNKQFTDPGVLLKQMISEYFADDAILVNVSDMPTMMLDTVRIKLLMKNLLSNAIQYNQSENGQPIISLQLAEKAIVFNVKDFGKGIAEEHLAHLTEPFYRVDVSRRRETGGYGLGLYLCRIIAEAHNGKLEIDSYINQGTNVTVTIPILTI